MLFCQLYHVFYSSLLVTGLIKFNAKLILNLKYGRIKLNINLFAMVLSLVERNGARMDSQDLTEGSVVKQLLRYSAPLVLSNLLQAMYSMIDTIVAGQIIGATGISAINNSSQIMNMVTQIIVGLTTGGNILIGQYFGSKDNKNLQETAITLFSFTMIFGVALSALMFFVSRPLLVLLNAPALEEAEAYLRICSVGIIFIMGYNAMRACVMAVGNSKTPLFCIATTTGLNLILDIAFVAGLKMGTEGAALATVISQALSFTIMLVYVLKRKELFGLSLNKLYIKGQKVAKILKLGVPCAVQMSIAAISWLSVTYIINDYGVFISAGNGVSIKIKDFCQLFITAMLNAAASMISQNLGAGKFDRAKEILYTSMKVTVGISVILIIIVQLFAPLMASAFTKDQNTIDSAVLNLRIEIFGQIFYAVFLMYHALALGAGHTIFVFGSSFVNCILVRMILAFTFNHFFGLTGLYVACMIAPASSIPLGMIYTRSNIWQRSLAESTNTA